MSKSARPEPFPVRIVPGKQPHPNFLGKYPQNPLQAGPFPGILKRNQKAMAFCRILTISYGNPYDKHCFVPRRKGPAPNSMAREASGISR